MLVQLAYCSTDVSHAAPPYALGVMMLRVRSLTPGPHDVVQAPWAPHCESTQSTGAGVGGGVGGMVVVVVVVVVGEQSTLSTVTMARHPCTMLGCGSAASAHR